ncbi:uncharacterized protein LOC135943305 isoform X1 [Cloeon dipterum]|uniref:uncharacterized protein LOC135943305 isoform X1 n=2 Tax=Cloeon dipterum TaxID=197152 RepID=UPI00321FE6A2
MSTGLFVLLMTTVAACEGAIYFDQRPHQPASECRNFGKERPELEAPVYSPGDENLSFEDCGLWDGTGDMPWTVIIIIYTNDGAFASDTHVDNPMYGFLVSKQTVLVPFRSVIPKYEVENYRLYAGPCYSGPKTDSCKFGRGLLQQKVLSRESFFLKIQPVAITQHLRPICLWNRNNLQDSIFPTFIFTKKETKLRAATLLNHQQCYRNNLTYPPICDNMERLMCTGLELSGVFLTMKVANRHYLRAVEWGYPVLSKDLVENRILWSDIIYFVSLIVALSPDLTLMPKPPKPAKKIDFGVQESFAGCGEITQDKRRGRQRRDDSRFALIHHGTNAPIEQNPWHASLTVHLPMTEPNYDFCGGTLVSKRVVVTAAHCLYSPSTGAQYEAEWLEITLGMYNAVDSDEIGRQMVRAASVVIHQEYNHDRKDLQHDLALIIVKESSIQITERVKPACLWNREYDFHHIQNKIGKVVGFGLIENYSRPNILQKAFLRIAPHEDCFYSNKKFFSKNLRPVQNFCVGFPNNATNVCAGDSGGGLLIAESTSTGKQRFFLRGVVSFGLSKIEEINNVRTRVCDTNQFALFVDITYYMDWIVRNSPDISGNL